MTNKHEQYSDEEWLADRKHCIQSFTKALDKARKYVKEK